MGLIRLKQESGGKIHDRYNLKKSRSFVVGVRENDNLEGYSTSSVNLERREWRERETGHLRISERYWVSSTVKTFRNRY